MLWRGFCHNVIAEGNCSWRLVGFRSRAGMGEKKQLDILLKVSRRFIIAKPWTASLTELAVGTTHATYTGACAWFGFGFRSECVGMHVQAWLDCGACGTMAADLNLNKMPDPLPEAYYHNLARKIHSQTHNEADDLLLRYERYYPSPTTCECFAPWPLMGIARTQRLPNVLWHDSHVREDYKALADEYGLSYTVDDFRPDA